MDGSFEKNYDIQNIYISIQMNIYCYIVGGFAFKNLFPKSL